MSYVQVAVGLRRKAGDYTPVVFTGRQVVVNNRTDKITVCRVIAGRIFSGSVSGLVGGIGHSNLSSVNVARKSLNHRYWLLALAFAFI